MAKITEITPAQSARFSEWSQKWIDIGLSTESADFDKAVAAALRGYQLANLKAPMVVLRMGSPLAAVLGGALAWNLLYEKKKQVESQVGSQVWSQVWSQVGSQVGSQVESQVGSQVWSQVGLQVWPQVESQVGSQVWLQVGSQVESQVWSQVWSQVGSQVESQVWSQVESQVWSQVGSQVWPQVWSQVWSQVGSQVWPQVWPQVESQVGSQVWLQVWSQVESQVRSQVNADSYHGSLYAPWAAYVTFFRDVMGWRDPILDLFAAVDEALVQSCGWVWWHENVLAISDRPSLIKRDDQGRLHCDSGPAIAYRDGWSLWYWHGVSVPSEWITDKASLNATVALGQSNIEQRRAACEIVGWERILRDLKAKTIDRDEDAEVGELLEVKLPDAGKERFLRVMCGTKRVFAIPVPPTVRTALEASAWVYGYDTASYKLPEVRT